MLYVLRTKMKMKLLPLNKLVQERSDFSDWKFAEFVHQKVARVVGVLHVVHGTMTQQILKEVLIKDFANKTKYNYKKFTKKNTKQRNFKVA